MSLRGGRPLATFTNRNLLSILNEINETVQPPLPTELFTPQRIAIDFHVAPRLVLILTRTENGQEILHELNPRDMRHNTGLRDQIRLMDSPQFSNPQATYYILDRAMNARAQVVQLANAVKSVYRARNTDFPTQEGPDKSITREEFDAILRDPATTAAANFEEVEQSVRSAAYREAGNTANQRQRRVRVVELSIDHYWRKAEFEKVDIFCLVVLLAEWIATA